MYNYKRLNPQDCEFIAVGELVDIPPGERLFLEIDGKPIVIFNIGGEFFAIADRCSHDDGPLGDGDLEGWEIICPRHGARFYLRDGMAVGLPAVEDIPAYPVRVNEEKIEIGLPLKKGT